MTRDEVIAAFNAIRVWQSGDRRAVHKPLLVLLALSRVNEATLQTMDWSEAEPLLKSLLEEFGPDGSANTRHYPFWHLQTDGIWRLDGPADIVNRPPGATPTLTELRQNHVRGGFATPIYNALKADPELIAIVAQRIVDAHFPESIRGDVLDAVGLTPVEGLGSVRDPQRRRDPAFRAKVLLAYQYRCAVCGHDLRMGQQSIGLEAAHIKWFQANGPDEVPNGIAMCSLHHKVFDLGAFKILPETYQMVFSQHLNGSETASHRMLAYHGSGMILPQAQEYRPHPANLDWHARQVFKSPARSG
ncbi:MAG: HNH endonuclease [Betaproteobacteria bacterium]